MLRSKEALNPVRRKSDSFTLVELLTVMLIISILAALSLAAGFALFNQGSRSRAKGEIQAMSAAMEGYKADNGIYPQSDGILLTNTYVNYDGTEAASSGNYQTNSQLLYLALSGQTNYVTPPAPGTKSYMQFKVNQVGNNSSASTYSYVKDPWNHSYGYSTGSGTTTPPYNGSGFFDLWTTAGVTQAQESAKNTLTNTWISNWTQ